MTYARNQAIGDYGERIAADHLRSLGMAILARNWTCRFGEIDIVAVEGRALVVCEVKTRSSNTFGMPSYEPTGPYGINIRTCHRGLTRCAHRRASKWREPLA